MYNCNCYINTRMLSVALCKSTFWWSLSNFCSAFTDGTCRLISAPRIATWIRFRPSTFPFTVDIALQINLIKEVPLSESSLVPRKYRDNGKNQPIRMALITVRQNVRVRFTAGGTSTSVRFQTKRPGPRL